MKTKYLAIFAMLLLVIPMAFAQENRMNVEEIELEEPGILPDSPFYGLSRAVEKIQMAFTFNENSKAELGLRMAERRLSEAREMIEKNKTEFVPKLVGAYNQDMEQVRERVQNKLEECYGAETPECQRAYGLLEVVPNATMKHIAVLEGVLEKVPEQAKASIENAIAVSTRNNAEAMQNMKDTFRDMQRQGIEHRIDIPDFEELSVNGMPENNPAGQP